MPFQSLAQVKKLKELVKEGKVKGSTFMEWWHKTDFKNLPERKHGNQKPR